MILNVITFLILFNYNKNPPLLGPDIYYKSNIQHRILLFGHFTVCMEHFPCQCIWNSVSSQGWSDRIPLCRYIPGTHPVLRKTYFVFGSKHTHQNNFSLLIWFVYELSPKDSCTDRLDIGDTWLFLMSPCCALGFLYTMKCIPLCSMPRCVRPTSDWMEAVSVRNSTKATQKQAIQWPPLKEIYQTLCGAERLDRGEGWRFAWQIVFNCHSSKWLNCS